MIRRKLELRCYEPGHEQAFLDLHNRAYGESRTQEHWHWRYRANPLARTELAGAFDPSGRCLAVHAGITQRFVLDGRETLAMVQGDVAVDPELRQRIGGSSLALAVGRLFFERYCGGAVELIWGYPVPGLRRLVTRHLGIEILADLVFLVHELERPVPGPEGVELRTVDRFGPEVDELWERTGLGTATLRNAPYLNWRFAEHPAVDYLLLEARDRGNAALRGVCVLREGGWDPGILSLSEWLVPAEDQDAEHALVRGALDEARRRQKRCLACWFPPHCLQFHRFQVDFGFYAHATPYQQGFRSFAHGIGRDWLHENWYRTLGDIDFF